MWYTAGRSWEENTQTQTMQAIDVTSVFAVSSAINGVMAFALGAVVLWVGRMRALPNVMFFFFTLSMLVWNTGYFFWMRSSSTWEAMLWLTVLNAGAAFIPVLQYHWVLKTINMRRFFLPAGYVLATLLAIVPLTPFAHLYITDLTAIAGFPYWPQAGPLYIAYIALDYGLFFVLSAYETYRIVRYRSDEKLRGIARYILYAVLLASAAGATNFPLWFGVSLVPYGNLFTSVYILILTYAIFRYNFFGAKNITAVLGAAITTALLFVTIFVQILDIGGRVTWISINAVTVVFFLYFSRLVYRLFRRELSLHEKYQSATRRLEAANERLRAMDAAKSEMLSIAAHQLRTPITAMTGYLSLVLDGDTGEAIGEKTRAMITKVNRAAMRLALLVNNLLSMSRIDDQRMKYAMRPVQLEELVQETADIFRIVAEEKGLRLTVDVPREPLPRVLIDDGKFHEVIANLINNAIKYTTSGSITLRLWQKGDRVFFCVQDTGVGIASEALSSLFRKFSRADSEQLNTEGAGLGLYVCYNIVRAHGGRIWVTSEGKGKGSTFTVALPTLAIAQTAEVAENGALIMPSSWHA